MCISIYSTIVSFSTLFIVFFLSEGFFIQRHKYSPVWFSKILRFCFFKFSSQINRLLCAMCTMWEIIVFFFFHVVNRPYTDQNISLLVCSVTQVIFQDSYLYGLFLAHYVIDWEVQKQHWDEFDEQDIYQWSTPLEGGGRSRIGQMRRQLTMQG